MTRMVGYFQLGHVGRDRLVVEHQLRQCALDSGAALAELYVEAAPRQSELYSLLADLDDRHGTAILDLAHEVARRDGIDLTTLRYQAVPQQFWTAVADLEAAEGGYLVVPHLAHLDHLGTARRDLMDQLAATHPQIGLLDASTTANARASRAAEGGLLGEFSVEPVEPAVQIAEISTRKFLAQGGLSDMIPFANTLIRELVGPLIERSHILGQDHRITIRLARRGSGIAVRCWDTRDYAEVPPPATVVDICGGQVSRSCSRNGTLTLCDLPFPAVATASPSRQLEVAVPAAAAQGR